MQMYDAAVGIRNKSAWLNKYISHHFLNHKSNQVVIFKILHRSIFSQIFHVVFSGLRSASCRTCSTSSSFYFSPSDRLRLLSKSELFCRLRRAFASVSCYISSADWFKFWVQTRGLRFLCFPLRTTPQFLRILALYYFFRCGWFPGFLSKNSWGRFRSSYLRREFIHWRMHESFPTSEHCTFPWYWLSLRWDGR